MIENANVALTSGYKLNGAKLPILEHIIGCPGVELEPQICLRYELPNLTESRPPSHIRNVILDLMDSI
ncbi:unnamed protein product [Ceratitis capitata]|uniref:(Mediterranean fruit fly) hypothetical protein n=1 Tax=Ceratitis capitata TaxID=7213 RepID=A0A811VG90_CERCA|nr:unnamed protein product [Ceratitis capitata]